VKLLVYAGATFFSLVGVGLASGAFAGAVVEPVLAALALACGLLGALSAFVAARLDRITFLRFVAVVGLVISLIVGALLLEAESVGAATLALGGAAALVAAYAGLQLWRYYRTSDPVPDVLRGLFDEAAIMERSGIQLAGIAQPASVAPGSALEVRVYVQNCWDGPRRVRVELAAQRPLFRGRGRLQPNGPADVELRPCEAGHISFTCTATHDAAGPFDIWMSMSASGSRGERVRRRTATPLSVKWPLWFTLLALPWGIVHGGGARVRIHVRADGPRGAPPTNGPVWTPLWNKGQGPCAFAQSPMYGGLPGLRYRSSGLRWASLP
jgi:hypothetical protein